jgi:putative membrane protein
MKSLKNFLKGMFITLCTLVPGASGGTVAIILGVYDDIIHSCSSFFKDIKKHTLYLLPIGLGGLAGLVIFTPLLKEAIENNPYIMKFLFIGIILGGIPILFKKVTASGNVKPLDIVLLLFGFVIVFLMPADSAATSAMTTSKDFMSLVFLFIAGFIFAIALILPGISGTFLLLIFGLYETFLSAIDTRDVLFLAPLGLGLLVGTFATTKAIERLLQQFPRQTYFLIIGFVVGSLKPVFPGVPEGSTLVISIFSCIVGFLITFLMGKLNQER